MRISNIAWGFWAGLIGSLAAIFVLWGAWLLPTVGLILGQHQLATGAAVVALLGLAGGGVYGIIIGRKPLNGQTILVAGLILGLLTWVGGVLLLIPALFGLPPQIDSAIDHWIPLLAMILYGLCAAFLYHGVVHHRQRSINVTLAILALAAIISPVLLRAAVSTDPSDLELPPGYTVQPLATGLTYPTSIAVAPGETGNEDTIYIAESGFAYGTKTTTARILKLTAGQEPEEIATDFSQPINGLLFHDDALLISERGQITRLDLKTGERQQLVSNLPSYGDHHNNDLAIGPDGALYFGQGSATNAGVVGEDNFLYAWLEGHPEFHDIPSRDFTLTGENYTSPDLDTVDPGDRRATGAFSPFGRERAAGDVVAAMVPASAVIHRLDLETGSLSIFADGLRNPYGLAFDGEGRLFATNLGYDDRGPRAVRQSPDWVVAVEEGSWYGWPDFAGTMPLSDDQFASERGDNRNPLISAPPEITAPTIVLEPHYSPMKLVFAPEEFQLEGLYVALFGDGQPATGDLDQLTPTGVIRIPPDALQVADNGELQGNDDPPYEWFLKNTDKERAGRLGDGLKRTIDVKFSSDGRSLYVLDFGILEFTDMAPNAIPETGVLWKITLAD